KPTPGSTAGLKSNWPTPRMLAPSDGPNVAPCGFSVTDGAWFATWLMSVWLRASSISALTAVIAIGVSCRFCSRNCAVTRMTSPWFEGSAASGGGAFWACASAGVATIIARAVDPSRHSRPEGGGKLGLDPGLDDLAVHRSVHQPGCGQAIASQAGDEGLGAPVAERSACLHPLAAPCPAVQPGHLVVVPVSSTN